MEFERIRDRSLKNSDFEGRNSKILYLLYGILLFIFIIFIRLFYLQIDQNKTFCRLGEYNFLQTEVIPSQRGNVLDCNNNLLATNRPQFDLYWYGSGSFVLSMGQQVVIKKMASILGNKIVNDLLKKKIGQTERFSRHFLIKEDLGQDELCQISEQCTESNNLFIARRFKRVYPYNSLASHVLGYLRGVERYEAKGKYGLELLFQDDLSGQNGYIRHVINATGKRLFQKELKEASSGIDVVLTLDLKMQKVAESLFENGQVGSFIVMNPEDGSVKAMLSYPSFDPNLFLNSISEQEWNNKFSQDSPFLNRAIHAMYPPASIFKLVTFVAGLEEGVININSEFVCKGYTLFCGRKYFCQRHWGHGKLDAKKSLAVSCNIPCYDIARKISIDQLAAYAMRLGLGQKTNFLFYDKAGLIPTSYWKQAYKGERWWKGETLSACIGQSFLLVTPLQIARMISAICIGHLVKPRILKDEEVERYPLYISEKTLNFLREVMQEVVQRGTARRLKVFSDFAICAKTGTAQTISLGKQKKEAKSQLEHAWFASYFSHKGKNPLVMVILVENAGSSRPALKIAEKFLSEYQKILRYNYA